MKPFNRERALAGDPVITRNGRKVAQIAYFPSAQNFEKILFLIAGENIYHAYESGLNATNPDKDLFMAPKEIIVWMNIYPGTYSAKYTAFAYATEKEANDQSVNNRVGNKAWKLTIEE